MAAAASRRASADSAGPLPPHTTQGNDGMQFLASLHRSVAALSIPGTARADVDVGAGGGLIACCAAQPEERREAPHSMPGPPEREPTAAQVRAEADVQAAAAGQQGGDQQQPEPSGQGREQPAAGQPAAGQPAGYNPGVEELRRQEFRRLEGRVYAGKRRRLCDGPLAFTCVLPTPADSGHSGHSTSCPWCFSRALPKRCLPSPFPPASRLCWGSAPLGADAAGGRAGA